MDNGIDKNARIIAEQGILYYLANHTDFLVDVPEWVTARIEAELATPKTMISWPLIAEKQPGFIRSMIRSMEDIATQKENEAEWAKEEVEETHLCFNANDGHENGTGDCTNLVAIPGQICSMDCAMSSAEKIINEDAGDVVEPSGAFDPITGTPYAPPSKTWIGDGYDPLLTIIIHEVEGIPEIAFAGSNELAEKVWNKMMVNVAKNREEIAMADPHTELSPDYCCHSDVGSDTGVHCLHDSWDEQFFMDDEDIFRVEYKTLNGVGYPGEGVEIADGDQIRTIRPGTTMPVTILTTIHSGIPETWFVGSEEEAKEKWNEAMKYIEGAREIRAQRDGEEPDYSCDYADDGERTTKNSWDAG